jgi:hypothetical protein
MGRERTRRKTANCIASAHALVEERGGAIAAWRPRLLDM